VGSVIAGRGEVACVRCGSAVVDAGLERRELCFFCSCPLVVIDGGVVDQRIGAVVVVGVV
jgi:hypothetical protein